MTDPTPTPTRAEAEALCATLRYGCNLQQRDGEQAADMIQALHERAEAAERHKDAGWDQQRYWCDRYVNKTAALEKALVEARRAEAAAWNDAIEAAAKAAIDRQGRRAMGDGHGNSCYDIGVSDAASAIRALRRAALAKIAQEG